MQLGGPPPSASVTAAAPPAVGRVAACRERVKSEVKLQPTEPQPTSLWSCQVADRENHTRSRPSSQRRRRKGARFCFPASSRERQPVGGQLRARLRSDETRPKLTFEDVRERLGCDGQATAWPRSRTSS